VSQTTPKLGLLLEGENTLPVILGPSGFVTSCYCGFQYTFALKRPSTTPI